MRHDKIRQEKKRYMYSVVVWHGGIGGGKGAELGVRRWREQQDQRQ